MMTPNTPGKKGVVEVDGVAYPRITQGVHVDGDGLYLR